MCGQYHKIKCPICGTAIDTDTPLEYCPACKAYIRDRLWQAGDGTGITTAKTFGQNIRPAR